MEEWKQTLREALDIIPVLERVIERHKDWPEVEFTRCMTDNLKELTVRALARLEEDE